MPFDDKETPIWSDAEPLRSEPRGFAAEQMVTCEACLRANPPTRTSCLYCGAGLRMTEASASLQRPTLRKLEKWEQGFNAIILPNAGAHLSHEAMGDMAQLLRMESEDLKGILETGLPLPLARAATLDEASLIETRVAPMGVKLVVISDSDLVADDLLPRRVRACELTETELVVLPVAGSLESARVAWTDVALLVVGRLVVRQIEIEERKGRRQENELVDSREMTTDESVVDIYTTQSDRAWRISAANFDFSCLGARKAFVAAQNFSTLVTVLRECASGALYDDTYNGVRQALSVVWPLDQQTEGRGWRRQRPGRVNTEAVTTSDNEAQFTRYSRLRNHLRRHAGSSK